MHGGLVGSVDAQGESFAKGLDLNPLWPLKIGNKITNTVTVVGRGEVNSAGRHRR